jgi:predicted SprT family Zn-dependent metalloprotease
LFPKGMPRCEFATRATKRRVAYADTERNTLVFNEKILSTHSARQWVDTAAHEAAHIASPPVLVRGNKRHRWVMHGRMWKLTATMFGAEDRATTKRTPVTVYTELKVPPLRASVRAFSQPRPIFDPVSGQVVNPLTV